ncbi:response regulator [Pedobacter punctiformis]|uniref:Response regulator transcription factor n=1 Tax=Pedobacter punctiformis TaxID=3004097 RepID=A0ABT4LAU3_9SPHI|nr:response regulator transcription factor [Pedobacter sp. HCMS5-2]MCZ4243914.1 response regulator transcription factor [Pedobacter sp. HCMS5-2]
MKILVVDDNEMMRLVIKGCLINLFQLPEIYEASDLAPAFKLLKQQEFDLLILDINMPGGDSNPDQVREILKLQPELKICMFSGNDKNTFEQIYLDAGAVGFIQKDDSILQNTTAFVQEYF